MRIFLAPGRFDRRRGRLANAHLGSPDGERIVTDAFDAMYAACRGLVARGATGGLEVWNVGSAFASLYIRDIAVAARFTVREDRRRGPELVRYRPPYRPGLRRAKPKAALSGRAHQSDDSGRQH